MNRKIRTLLFCFFISFLHARAQQSISLAGEWGVRLDEQKTGQQQQWFRQSFDRKIHLPGTLDDAGIGAPPALTDASLTREVLLHLTRKHSYIGYAWYTRTVDIPQSWKGKSITLYLERVLWTTHIWVDGEEAGSCESLSAPHTYELGKLLTPGKHTIAIRVDNSKQYDISVLDMAHAYTEGTQIIWNGIIGKLQLIARSPAHIGSVQVYPSVKDRSISVAATIEDQTATAGKGDLLVQVLDDHKKVIASRTMAVALTPGSGTSTLDCQIALPTIKEWDEFTPVLYKLRAQLTTGGGKDTASVVFGMRNLGNKQSLLWINGHRLYLRGTLECNIFPLTGHPPMDKKGWLKEFVTAKAYGLNHLRFHSWCPPAAAFEVADSMGFYLQIELPFWNKNAGKDAGMNKFLENEADRISREYGSHPSFCLWSMGNELEGDFNWLAAEVQRLRQMDARHLYTSTTFTFQPGHGRWPEPDDDFYITQYTKKGWVRGQGIFNTYPPEFKSDYTMAVDSLPVPLIIHEMGQYSVYPDMKEIDKYTGVLDPLNFKAIRNDLIRKDLLGLAPAFTKASGKFSARLYKEEIERALRTNGASGFQLLDLHDFPGQGTALIGILDAFWDSKGLITPEEHRMFCSAVVPLIRFEKAAYTNAQRFTATAEVANFSRGVLKGVTPEWTMTDQAGRRITGGVLIRQDIPAGNGHQIGTFTADLSNIQQAACLTIELRLKGTTYHNKWNIWVYPASLPERDNGDGQPVTFDTTVDEALRHLQEGKNVLLNPDTADVNGVAGRFAPVFWSPVHFPNQPGTMGLLCHPDHPALKDFPTASFSDWQWWDLVTSSKTMILDSLPAIDPIVRVIDNFFKNRKMAEVIEAKVGKGKLILVSADITHDLENRPAARQLRYSLEKYMHGSVFNPAAVLSPRQLEHLVSRPSETLHKQVDAHLQQAARQMHLLMQHTSRDSFPETFDPRKHKYGMGRTTSWMSGFYPGELLYLFQATHDTALYTEAVRKLNVLEKEQYNKDTHDLGFMMYCSFGNALHIAPYDTAYRTIIMNSARSLASRFNPKVGCTRSWNSDSARFMVIIDNMMNLELLTQATKMSGDSSFYKTAVTHANTTIDNHFRPDYSSFHLVIYDPHTGQVQKKQTVQGAADGSAWARGQAWGLYGYTMMYRETRDRKYLEQAEHIAGFILPRLPADKIPYWDFDAPGIPNTDRDVSAGAIMCSALIELAGYAEPPLAEGYLHTAEAMLRSLLSPAYSAVPGHDGGFLLQHGVGNHPKNSDIDVSIIYADYYFIEAMLRWQRMAPATVRAQTDSILIRYRKYLYGGARTEPAQVARWAATYDPVRQWPDIDYTDTQRANWQLLNHLGRIDNIALAWSDPRSGHFHDGSYWKVINQALDHWLEKRYHNPNWWQNEIGVPQLMRDILVQLHDTLTPERFAGTMQVLGQYRLQPPGAGANLAWSADLGLHYGALAGNDSIIRLCAGRMADEIRITTADGVQPDYSFHQHAARLQMYQYGSAYLAQNVRLAWQLKGTSWAFPDEKIKLLADFVLNGWQWMCRGVNTVPGTIDRSVSRPDALRNADMRSWIPYLCELHPQQTTAFRALAECQDGHGENLQGFRYFPYSDFSAYQDKRFSFFIKTVSDRTLTSESINSENLKGRLMNSGDAYIIRNGNEYFNLMPVWDWSKLPGITSFAGADRIVRHPFTGGVSDSTGGLTVMDYELGGTEGRSLSAHKYWACHDGIVVCLIAGLRINGPAGPPGPGGSTPPYTVLDQCKWQGDITVDDPKHVLPAGDHSFPAAKWIHHNGVAYIFLQPTTLNIHAGEATGSWYAINLSQSAAPVTAKLFTPVISHPAAGAPLSSGYILTACEDALQTQALAKKPTWKILRNDSACQAVRFQDGTVMCAFWQPAAVETSSHDKLSVDAPCLALVSGDKLYISDPSQSGKEVNIVIDGKTQHIRLPKDGTTVSLTR